MSRSTQWFGLSKTAQDIVEGNQVLLYTDYITRVYPGGSVKQFFEDKFGSDTIIGESGEVVLGMFDEEFKLKTYQLADGSLYEEYVQAEPWSSGPCIFLALRNVSDKTIVEASLWDQKVIDNC